MRELSQHDSIPTAKAPFKVRCAHCRTFLLHDPQHRRPCSECGSQLAMHNGEPIMIAKNASDGVPLKHLDPKKRRLLIPKN